MSFGETFNIGGVVASVSNPTVTNVTSASGNEGTSLVHTVTLSAATTASTNYAYSLGGGTSTSVSDYTVPPTFSAGVTLSGGTLTVPSGVSSFTVSVAALSDGSSESSETYNLTVGGVTGVGTISDAGATDANIAPSVTTSRTGVSNTGVAPFGVTFNSTATNAATYTSKPFAELFHDWNFGDPSSGVHGYGTRAGSASRNTASGAIASHVFETPGSYTVTYTAWNPGTLTYNTTTVSITVQDPETVFASDTVYVSTGTISAGSGGIPGGANVQSSATWANIITLAGTYKRILLKAGDTFTTTGTCTLLTGPGIIGKFGAGANPKININTNAKAFANAYDWRFVDVEFYSTLTGAPATIQGVRILSGIGTEADYATFVRADAYGVHNALVLNTGNSTGAVGVGVYQSNWYDMSSGAGNTVVYADNLDYFAVVGSRMFNSDSSHTLRMQGATNSVVSHSEIDGGAAANTLDAFTIRERYTYSPLWTENIVVSDCYIKGADDGTWAFSILPQNTGLYGKFRDIVVERNYFKNGLDDAGATVTLQITQDVTFRSNIVLTRSELGVNVAWSSLAASPACTSYYIYNNTIVQVASPIHTTFSPIWLTSITSGNLTGGVIRNNLAYGPGSSAVGGTSTYVYDNAGVTGADYTLSNSSTFAQITGTKPWAANPAVSYADYTPNGYAIDAGTTVPVYDDFFAIPLSGTPDMGAIQV